MMRSHLLGLAIAALALAAVSGCSTAKAQVAMPESAPLSIPPAPARVVVPPTPDPPPAHTETPLVTASGSANPPSGGSRPVRDTRPVAPPANPQPATPTPAPSSPATPLETPANQSELEQRTQGLLVSANTALAKINPQSLSSDGKAQYDAAKRFVAQADAALKVKNVVYAWQLADKANTIATLLLRHS